MDLKQHLIRQMAFSHATLALDGLTRRLAYIGGAERANPDYVAEIACNMIVGKQTHNEARVWPDWRTSDPRKAIEHVKQPGN